MLHWSIEGILKNFIKQNQSEPGNTGTGRSTAHMVESADWEIFDFAFSELLSLPSVSQWDKKHCQHTQWDRLWLKPLSTSSRLPPVITHSTLILMFFLLCVCPLLGNWEWPSTLGRLHWLELPPSSEAWSEWPSVWPSSSLNPPTKSHMGFPSWSL